MQYIIFTPFLDGFHVLFFIIIVLQYQALLLTTNELSKVVAYTA